MGSIVYKRSFNEIAKNVLGKDWLFATKRLFNIHSQKLQIRFGLKSEYALVERICKIFTLKLGADKQLHIPLNLSLALLDGLVAIERKPDANEPDSDEEVEFMGANADVGEKRNYDSEDEDEEDDKAPKVMSDKQRVLLNIIKMKQAHHYSLLDDLRFRHDVHIHQEVVAFPLFIV